MNPTALFHSVTHGASSNHAHGFSGPNMPLLSHNTNPNAALVASKPGTGNSANTTVPTPTGPSIK
eukprot:10513121-Ditylum_brightwellii.AAC.1